MKCGLAEFASPKARCSYTHKSRECIFAENIYYFKLTASLSLARRRRNLALLRGVPKILEEVVVYRVCSPFSVKDIPQWASLTSCFSNIPPLCPPKVEPGPFPKPAQRKQILVSKAGQGPKRVEALYSNQ
jgi:hypothetical protein